MTIKLTYKRNKETGLARIGAGTSYEVKHKRKEIGHMSYGAYHSNGKTTIQIAVKNKDTEGVGCSWMWLFHKFENSEDKTAKDVCVWFVNKLVSEGYELHYFERD